MSNRDVPFRPSSARALVAGDLVGVPTNDGRWACLQVVEVRPNSRTTFYVALLDWRGHEPPTVEAVSGAKVIKVAMTRIDLFTEGLLEITAVGSRVDQKARAEIHDNSVGSHHRVWGWRAAIQNAGGIPR